MISDLLAHLWLLGRHRRTAVVFGLSYRYCNHRSHRHAWPCWRWYTYDGYCGKHNASCYTSCPTDHD